MWFSYYGMASASLGARCSLCLFFLFCVSFSFVSIRLLLAFTLVVVVVISQYNFIRFAQRSILLLLLTSFVCMCVAIANIAIELL